ncbi:MULTISPECIES: site-specific integrase [Butyricimonas]|uniref:site-specific integrase n=1 Tax=Butyricimonas TaxID=574697 RepID=UPI0007FB4E65|nr:MULTISPECIES: site-specific integrase [Butyricimonas]
MASAVLTIDERSKRKDNTYPVIIRLTCNRKTTAMAMGISIPRDMWVKGKIGMEVKKTYPNASLINADLLRSMNKVQSCILQLEQNGKIETMNVTELKKYILDSSREKKEEENHKVIFAEYYRNALDLMDNERTREIYTETLKKVVEYGGVDLTFEEMNVPWIKAFDKWLKKDCPSLNTRSLHLRNIRKIFNDALDDELISVYPFRKYKIESKKMSDTMPLTIEQMRAIRDYQAKCESIEIAKDVFMATFYLIGINSSDLYELKKGSRCVYKRNKTGKRYDIGLQPELLELIEKYKDDERMFSFYKRYRSTHAFNANVNFNLKVIGKVIGEPGLKLYHARHTHATIARKLLHISKEDVAEMLGHGSFDVTDIYARYDTRQIDENNRKVIDCLNQVENK